MTDNLWIKRNENKIVGFVAVLVIIWVVLTVWAMAIAIN